MTDQPRDSGRLRRRLRRGFRLGPFDVYPLNGEIEGPHGSHAVRPETMEVLMRLAAANGATLSEAELTEEVWGPTPDSAPRLDRCIRELEASLRPGPDQDSLLRRTGGGGYRLASTVRSFEPGAADGDVVAAEQERVSLDTRLKGFLTELRRRRVFRIGAVYLMGAWLVIQIGETTFPALGIPDWVLTLIIVLAIMGFPIALLLTWALQLTPDGLVVDLPQGGRRGRWRHAYILGLAALLISVPFLGYRLVAPDEESASAEREGPGQLFANAPENSIAVLPFQNMSDAQTDEYLADGLAEEILNVLVRVSDLKVAARTSSFYFKGRNEDIRSIAGQLGVSKVLEGSVRRAGDTLRVTAQLINASDGFHLWSQTYDRSTDDLFAIQDEIAKQVVAALELVLSEAAARAMAAGGTENISAYDFYLQGRAFLREPPNAETLAQAEDLFEKSLTLDPAHARAYAGLCETYLLRFQDSRAADAFEKAEAACARGSELDASNPAIYLALGQLYLFSGRPALAEEQLDAALARDVNSVEAYTALAQVFEDTGRLTQAETIYEKAIDLQPGYWAGHNRLGAFLFRQNRLDEAVMRFRKVTELAPDSAKGFSNLAAVYLLQGELEESAAALEGALAIEPTRSVYANIGTTKYFLHRFDEAAAAYREAIRLAPEDHRVWGYLGDAYTWLPGKEEDARQAYREAIRLAGSELLIDDSDNLRIAALAHYHASLGDAPRAQRLIATALEQAADDPEVYYGAALVYARTGESEKAVVALQRALEEGYAIYYVTGEPQFEPLLGDERLQRLQAGSTTP